MHAVPEFMQATKGIVYKSIGRRLRMQDFVEDSGRGHRNGMQSTLAARLQNWLDADGSASDWLGQPSILGSAVAGTGSWWVLDDECLRQHDGLLWQCKTLEGPRRQIGSLNMQWTRERAQNEYFGTTACGNGDIGMPCGPLGYIKHHGQRYLSGAGHALPVTLNGKVTGALGGFGWLLRFNAGGPRSLTSIASRCRIPRSYC